MFVAGSGFPGEHPLFPAFLYPSFLYDAQSSPPPFRPKVSSIAKPFKLKLFLA